MNLKKLITLTLFILVLFGGISSVSAEWFDFLSVESMTNQDFGNFTMDVPDNVKLENKSMINTNKIFEFINDSSNKSFNDSDPTYVHPQWLDANAGDDYQNLSIEYVDYKEDGRESLSNYNDAKFIKEDENVRIYNLSKTFYENDNYVYGVSKANGDKSIVIITGYDLESITEMAKSIEFK